MMVLGFGVLVFAALHLVAAAPPVRQLVRQRIGEVAYGPLFGIASVIGVIIIIAGWRMSGLVPVYEPAVWGRYANHGLTLIAFLCIGVFIFRGKMRQRLRFPMGLAVIFWAVGHLLANGDLASLILFGGMLVYAAAHIAIAAGFGLRPSRETRQGHDLLSVMGGIALYGVMAQLHQALMGVPVFSLG